MKWENMKKLFGSFNLMKNRFKDVLPNVCPKCGEKYLKTDDFFSKTEEISSVLEKTESGNPTKIKIKCRCCSCKHIFSIGIDKQRDFSGEGCYVRNKFGQILEMLMAEGMSRENARKEMLKLFDEQERIFSKKKL
jgi:hypothetical protein